MQTLETKPWYKTSEFWSLVFVNAGVILSACVGITPAAWVPVINSASAGVYALSRGIAKSGVKPDEPR